MRRGGGVGYDFSRIRPRGALVGGTQSRASGPVSYMRVFDRSCETVESRRRAARRADGRAALRPSRHRGVHPRQGRRASSRNFNISVGVTDAFMQAVRGRRRRSSWCTAPSRARRRRPTARTSAATGCGSTARVRARELWDQIMRSTYDHAEPGVLFLDRINRDNNLSYCETIEATQSLRASSRCPRTAAAASASIDLTRFVRDPFERRRALRLRGASPTSSTVAVRMLDNVLDVTPWPLPQQREEARNKRRVGLGFTGLGDALVMLGLRYDTRRRARDGARASPRCMRDAAYVASVELARERGAFPLFNADLYLPRGSFRLAPAAGAQGAHPQARHPQFAPAVDRARPARSASPSPTTPATASSRRSRGPTRARSAWPTARTRSYASRTTRGACTGTCSGEDAQLPPALRHRAGDERARAPARWWPRSRRSSTPAISKTVNVPEDYPYDEFQDLYLRGVAVGPEGPRHLPAERRARRGADASTQRTREPRCHADRRQPPPRARVACREPVLAACAGRAAPSCRAATRRGPT